jgi:hypothetical protein
MVKRKTIQQLASAWWNALSPEEKRRAGIKALGCCIDDERVDDEFVKKIYRKLHPIIPTTAV